MQESAPISTAAAAKILGLSVERTRQLDEQLAPTKMADGRRLYDRARVEALRDERAAAKGGGR
jgi:hypothetical protein